MRLVEKPLMLPPHNCLVTGRDDGKIIDFEVDALCSEPPHVYLKREVVEAAAKEFCGMVPAHRLEALEKWNKELNQKFDELYESLWEVAEFEEKIKERIAA